MAEARHFPTVISFEIKEHKTAEQRAQCARANRPEYHVRPARKKGDFPGEGWKFSRIALIRHWMA
jgi:hypothetical protein